MNAIRALSSKSAVVQTIKPKRMNAAEAKCVAIRTLEAAAASYATAEVGKAAFKSAMATLTSARQYKAAKGLKIFAAQLTDSTWSNQALCRTAVVTLKACKLE